MNVFSYYTSNILSDLFGGMTAGKLHQSQTVSNDMTTESSNDSSDDNHSMFVDSLDELDEFHSETKITVGSGQTSTVLYNNIHIHKRQHQIQSINSQNDDNRNDNIIHPRQIDVQLKQSKKVHVTFSNICKVILIPSRKEYIDAGIDLWFDYSIITENRNGLRRQCEQYMFDHPGQDPKEVFHHVLLE